MKFLVGLLTGLVIVLLIVMSIHLSEPKVKALNSAQEHLKKYGSFYKGSSLYDPPDYLK